MMTWLVRSGAPLAVFNLIKSSLQRFEGGLIAMNQAPKFKRTEVQKRFDTDLTWAQTRWSIARIEHELFDREDWTHDVEDCVHPDCNKKAVQQLAHGEHLISAGEIKRLGEQWTGVRDKRLKDHLDPSYECPDCHSVSYNSNDIANKYCGACHRFHLDTRLPDPGNPQKY